MAISNIISRYFHTPALKVKIWNDISRYKKIFIAQGFFELDLLNECRMELVEYDYFVKHGAPPPVVKPWPTHQNMVVLEIEDGKRRIKVVYDNNDRYYAIPNELLKWSDIYFKANFQPAYLNTGEFLSGPYWGTEEIHYENVPEPLALDHTWKILPCSFTCVLYDNFFRNSYFLKKMEGLWQKTPVHKKPYDYFYKESYWGNRKLKELKTNIMDYLSDSKKQVVGGLLVRKDPLPEKYQSKAFKEVPLDNWCKLAQSAKLSIYTRGLDGCLSFKALNYLMLGSPFAALELKANFYQPLVENLNFFCIKDDLSNLEELSNDCENEELLRIMGKNNLLLWQQYISPIATARLIVRSAFSG